MPKNKSKLQPDKAFQPFQTSQVNNPGRNLKDNTAPEVPPKASNANNQYR